MKLTIGVMGSSGGALDEAARAKAYRLGGRSQPAMPSSLRAGVPGSRTRRWGTTTTPFDMVVRNDLDRFHLVGDVIDRVPGLGAVAVYTKQAMRDKLVEHRQYIERHGEDMPEIGEWTWEVGEIREPGSEATV